MQALNVCGQDAVAWCMAMPAEAELIAGQNVPASGCIIEECVRGLCLWHAVLHGTSAVVCPACARRFARPPLDSHQEPQRGKVSCVSEANVLSVPLGSQLCIPSSPLRFWRPFDCRKLSTMQLHAPTSQPCRSSLPDSLQ